MPPGMGSSGAATPPVVPAPASWLGAARVLPCVSWPQLPSPGSVQLGCCHESRGGSSRLLAQGSSGAVTCPVTPAPTSCLRAASEPPRVPWLQLPPPGSGQLRSHHVSRGFSSRLLAQGSFGAATCPMELYGLWVIEVNKYPPVTLPS
jgi:hypothetical protein